MGLTFTVGRPSDVFLPPLDAIVERTFLEHFGPDVLARAAELLPYFADEVAWSGWCALQQRALTLRDASALPNLLAMEAWQGVYLPWPTSAGSFSFEGIPTPLEVAELDGLVAELEDLGPALNLSTDDPSLRDQARNLMPEEEGEEDEDEADEANLAVPTYLQLLLAAHEAQRRRQPLWVVK